MPELLIGTYVVHKSVELNDKAVPLPCLQGPIIVLTVELLLIIV